MELLTKEYYLINEVAVKLNITNAAFSLWNNPKNARKDGIKIIEGITFRKYGNCIFQHRDAMNVTKRVKEYLNHNKTKDFSEYLPKKYFCDELGIKENKLKIFGNVEIIYNKSFIHFNEKFYKIFKKYVFDVLPLEECKELYENKEILGYQEISKENGLYWY